MDWYVASAKYGIVHNSEVIESYDLRLDNLTQEQYKEWTERAAEKILQIQKDNLPIVCLLSNRYLEMLPDGMFNMFFGMSGLSLGVAGRSKRLVEIPILTKETYERNR